MDSTLYTALSGATRAMDAQQIHASNLANINTDGFRADYLNVMARTLKTGKASGSTAQTESTQHWSDFRGGSLSQTGRDLDLALEGEGWFAVLDDQGNEAYTRAGGFHVDHDGILRTTQGLAVAGEGGAISLPEYEDLVIGSDGRLSVKVNGAKDSQIAQVDRLKLVNPEASDLRKGADGLFRLRDKQMAEASEAVSVVSGYLENSNVSGVREMVALTSQSRNFEIQLKMMRATEQINQAGNELLKG